jgi:uncharacterized protein (TIGR02271 family)
MSAMPGGGEMVPSSPSDRPAPPIAGDGSHGPDAAGGRALIRSEERLDITTSRVPSGRVRLEKFVVTETRTVIVEARREEVRVVRLDVDEAVAAGSADTDEDPQRWLTLHEERVVVATEVVPVERVRLDVRTVVEHRDVTAELRSERVAFEPDPAPFRAGGVA